MGTISSAITRYLPEEEIENFTLYDLKIVSKVRSYQEESPAVALKKHPDLAGVLAAKAVLQKEIANMPQQSQAIMVSGFDENAISAIQKNEIPELQVTEASFTGMSRAQDLSS